MKKTLLPIVVLSIILLASGCANQQDNQKAAQQTDQPTSTVSAIKEFSMTAKKWEFEPSQISVNKGDRVKLKIKSLDVKHGFSIPEFNIKANLNPGQETIVEFTADKTGAFTFSCSVYCGSGHGGMKGTLIVK